MADAPANEEAAPVEPVISLAEQLPPVNDWLPQALQPIWNQVSNHPLLGALTIAFVFWVFALILRGTLFHILHRLVDLTDSDTDDAILGYLRKPVFTTVNTFGLILAVQVAQLPGALTLNKILLSIIAFSWIRGLLNISSTALDALSKGDRFQIVETRTVPMFDITSKVLIILIGSYVLLMIWGINPVGWLASAGVVGIAVGFAAKDTLGNLFSGFFIVADAPYKIGDYINLDSGERGMVNAIGLRSTRLLTRDDVEVTIPNGVIAAAKIVNESGGHSPKMRIRINVGAAYGSDVDQVAALLKEIGITHENTCSFPEPRVRLRAFGASSLDFQLMCWIELPQDRGRITHELLMEIYKVFAREGVEIPYSKHDIYIKELPEKQSTET
ncbi:MAG: mechanosensitive ion channel family protein [Pseudomonadota bacterium]